MIEQNPLEKPKKQTFSFELANKKIETIFFCFLLLLPFHSIPPFCVPLNIEIERKIQRQSRSGNSSPLHYITPVFNTRSTATAKGASATNYPNQNSVAATAPPPNTSQGPQGPAGPPGPQEPHRQHPQTRQAAQGAQGATAATTAGGTSAPANMGSPYYRDMDEPTSPAGGAHHRSRSASRPPISHSMDYPRMYPLLTTTEPNEQRN